MHNKIPTICAIRIKIQFFIFEKIWYNGGFSFLEGLYMNLPVDLCFIRNVFEHTMNKSTTKAEF
jgi:hypothetical protein